MAMFGSAEFSVTEIAVKTSSFSAVPATALPSSCLTSK